MDLGDLRSTVLKRLGIRDTDRFFSPDDVDEAINRAQERVDTEHDWTWLSASETVTLTAGDASNALPANWKSTKAVYYQGETLTVLSESELRYRQEGNAGSPWGYYIGNGTLDIAPEPNDSVSLVHSYYKWSPALADDNDEPLIPKPWRQVLVWAAVADLAPDREDYELAGKAEAQYQDAIAKMRKSLRPTKQPWSVRVRPGGWI
jgi:hypothetical protein